MIGVLLAASTDAGDVTPRTFRIVAVRIARRPYMLGRTAFDGHLA
jgi:hypothetical protein